MNNPTILLIEDDANDEEFFRLAVEELEGNHILKVARNGSEAMDLILAMNLALPHLIVLDLKLPKISGLEVLKAIKESPKTKKIPTIVFSSSMEEKDKAQCYNHGVNDFVRKPIEFQEFTNTVKDIITLWLQKHS